MNWTIKPKSIKSQVNIVLVVGIGVMIIVLGFLSIKGVNQQTRELMLNNALQITEGLAQQSVFPILSGAVQNAQDSMKQVSGFKSVEGARLLLEDATLFLSRGDFSTINHLTYNAKLNTIKYPAVIHETENIWLLSTPIYLDEDENLGDESEFELEINTSARTIIGYAQILYSKANLIEIQSQVVLIVTSVGFTSILLLSFILHLALAHLFSPLNKLAKIMHQSRISGEHLQAKVQGAIEINEMANAYNSMMEVLDSQDEKLKQHRDRLEDQVEQRTLELVIARDSAIQASKHKSEFIANMSHELRTPIQSIIGYGELVVEELELEGNLVLIDDMDKIAKNSQRLLQMINSLLDLAKIEAGHMELTYSMLKIDELIESLSDTIKPIAYQNNNIMKITNNCINDEITIDKEKLEHVLLNLLSNACKFTENGEISLELTVNNGHLVAVVKDTGIGLSQEQQLFIFDEFRQVDASQKRMFNGTGLGLAISKRFIELMSGVLTVKSKLGQGSSFIVKLPLIPD